MDKMEAHYAGVRYKHANEATKSRNLMISLTSLKSGAPRRRKRAAAHPNITGALEH